MTSATSCVNVSPSGSTIFLEQGIRGADFFISAIGPAVEVFGRYIRVRKLTGQDVSVAELLDLVQEMVADYALRQVSNGRYQMERGRCADPLLRHVSLELQQAEVALR